MSNVLLLVHRIPFPPDKGDKIRSYHLLRHLVRRHRVFLGTFIDDPDDQQHVAEVEKFCAQVFVRPVGGWRSRLGAAAALARGESLSVCYYRDRPMRHWVENVLQRERINSVVAFSSTMAQYFPKEPAGQILVADFVDVDSDKWRQYAAETRWPRSVLYRYEARALAQWESDVVGVCDVVSVVSETERGIVPLPSEECSSKIRVVPNGVDADYFDPGHAGESPYKPDRRVVVFTGAMDYYANVDGVCWFAEQAWPCIRERAPDAEFWIVGSNPAPAVTALAKIPGVNVTGRVPDVRPYVRHATLAVAPLRLARGIQNKVLEALAMGRPVVASPQALQGLERPLPASAVVAEADREFVAKVCDLLPADQVELRDGRRYVLDRYDWHRNLHRISDLVLAEGCPRPDMARPAPEGTEC